MSRLKPSIKKQILTILDRYLVTENLAEKKYKNKTFIRQERKELKI